jgi:hypothetical protein
MRADERTPEACDALDISGGERYLVIPGKPKRMTHHLRDSFCALERFFQGLGFSGSDDSQRYPSPSTGHVSAAITTTPVGSGHACP